LKLDVEFLDKKPEDELTWKEWISLFTPLFQEQYDKIIRAQLQKRMRKSKSSPKFKAIKWGPIRAWIDSPKTPEHTRKKYREALKLHEKGLSDDEVKERMEWKK